MKILLADYVRDRTILIRLFFFPIAFTYAFIYILYSSVGELTTRVFNVVFWETFQKLELRREEEEE
jgi:hypothetical protein